MSSFDNVVFKLVGDDVQREDHLPRGSQRHRVLAKSIFMKSVSALLEKGGHDAGGAGSDSPCQSSLTFFILQIDHFIEFFVLLPVFWLHLEGP